MKKDECLTVDWYGIGYEDGTRGYKTSRIAKHRKSCAKYGVVPDLHLYQSGQSEGLKEYCTQHNGYRLGLNGRSYNDVCKGELKGLFQQGYHMGRDTYSFKQGILKNQKTLDKLDKEMLQIKELIIKKEAQISKECSIPKKCRQLLDDIRILDKEKRKLKFKIISREDLIEAMKQTLSDMKAQNRFNLDNG